MTLEYNFEHIWCVSIRTSLNPYGEEPIYDEGYEDVSYDYDVEISEDDFVDFMKPKEFNSWDHEKKEGCINTLRHIYKSNLVDLETLECNEYFIEYMKDKYYDVAREQCIKECGVY